MPGYQPVDDEAQPSPPPLPAEAIEWPPGLKEALVIRSGDRLLVRVDPSSDRATVETLRNALQERLPGVAVIVLAAEQLAVVRGG